MEELKAKIKRRDDELDTLYEENDQLRGDADGCGDGDENVTIVID